jgi:uncharacterized protein DUF4037
VDSREIEAVTLAVECGLPSEFRSWPVQFFSWQTDTVRHHIEVTSLGKWLISQFGFDPRTEMSTAAWLATPQQSFLQVTAGAVFRDDIGDLTAVRALLSWYPRDVWLWMMASQWHLIGNTEPLIGRTAECSDALGARLIASRLVRLAMELSFLQERRYWPYNKWFGTAFSRLESAGSLGAHLDALITARDHQTREQAAVRTLRVAAERHNSLGVTPNVDAMFGDFQVGVNNAVRPYRVLNAGRFGDACKSEIKDEALKSLVVVGAFDQLTHADDQLVNFTSWPRRLAQVYRRLLDR